MIVDEGDPFNDILFDKSIKDISSKNIFKKVDYEVRKNNSLNKVIDILVEENQQVKYLLVQELVLQDHLYPLG